MVMRATSNEMDPDARNDDVQFDLHDEEEDIVLRGAARFAARFIAENKLFIMSSK